MDCEEGAWSLVMACICLCLLNSVQEPSCSLSCAGQSWVTPSRHQQQRGRVWPYNSELPRSLLLWGPRVLGTSCSRSEPGTGLSLKPRALGCAVGTHRVILGVPARTAPSSGFEMELRDLVKWSRFTQGRDHLWFPSSLS